MCGSSSARVAVAASKAFEAVLKEFKIDGGKGQKETPEPEHTHTSMAGGSYRVASPEDRERLMAAYCAALEAGRVDLHLVEQPDAAAMPLLVDLDFRLPKGESLRRYDAETVTDFLRGYVRCAGKYVECDRYVWYVLEKPGPRRKDRSSIFKDGLHLVCPGVVTSAAVQRAIRADFLADPYNEGFFEAQGTSSAEEAYDLAVLGVHPNAWMMYGSRKAKGDPSPWAATRVIEVDVQSDRATGLSVRSRPAEGSASALVRLLSVHRERTGGSECIAAAMHSLTAAGKAVVGCEHSADTLPAAPAIPEMQVVAIAPHTHTKTHQGSQDTAVASQLVELLSDARADLETAWIRVGWCLHNIDAGGLLPAWEAFSRRSPKHVPGECARRWALMHVDAPGSAARPRLLIGSLHMWARTDSPAAYAEAAKARVVDGLQLLPCNGTHSDIARVAASVFSGRYVYSDSKTWYAFQGGRWRADATGAKLRVELTSTLRDYFVAVMNRLADSASIDDLPTASSSGSTSSGPGGGQRAHGGPADGVGAGEPRLSRGPGGIGGREV